MAARRDMPELPQLSGTAMIIVLSGLDPGAILETTSNHNAGYMYHSEGDSME
jgi:hypothetical protein